MYTYATIYPSDSLCKRLIIIIGPIYRSLWSDPEKQKQKCTCKGNFKRSRNRTKTPNQGINSLPSWLVPHSSHSSHTSTDDQITIYFRVLVHLLEVSPHRPNDLRGRREGGGWVELGTACILLQLEAICIKLTNYLARLSDRSFVVFNFFFFPI